MIGILSFVLFQKNISVDAGSQPDEATEIIGKVALVTKAGGKRGVQRGSALLQKLFRLPDPDVFQVAVGCDSFQTGESAQKRGSAQAAVPADLLQCRGSR